MDFEPIKNVLNVALEFLPSFAFLAICYSITSLVFTYYQHKKDKAKHAKALDDFLAVSEKFQREQVDLRNTTDKVVAQHAEISIEFNHFVADVLEETRRLRLENEHLRAELEKALAKNGEVHQK